MNTLKNMLLVLVVIFFGACSKLPLFRKIIPENTIWALNTSKGCGNYIYITKNFPYNNNIVNNLNELKSKGDVVDYTKHDSAEESVFNITFIKADTINTTKLLIPYRGGYSREEVKNILNLFISHCDKNNSDTIFLRSYKIKKDKFVWDDFFHKYKFYPTK